MSDSSIVLTNYVRRIELDVTENKQRLDALSNQFKNKFAPNVTDEDVTMIQKASSNKVSVKRCQIIEYPDQLGQRTIATNFEELEGKKVSNRLNVTLKLYTQTTSSYYARIFPMSSKSHLYAKFQNNLQDPNRSDSFNEAFEGTGRDQSPIIADVLSPQVEVASKPSRLFIPCTFHSNDDIFRNTAGQIVIDIGSYG
ncbi:uncharacterized protein EV154DRAFT_482191 [Mucor mucedo]|uniref:uncharacterized protein n=1 Tax=Mucor mucedo TaxID=29922 RepID=UPI00221F3668|nr:uncharacterized protein EV154DRAFT_482191 [Mucor mucedo]KAI7890464.1 hypothetical protein EV154DRAFT_482191 [Mucor mucedo]